MGCDVWWCFCGLVMDWCGSNVAKTWQQHIMLLHGRCMNCLCVVCMYTLCCVMGMVVRCRVLGYGMFLELM